MSLDLHPLSVTLIDRDMLLAAIQVAVGFPPPAADDLEDTVDPFKWVIRHEHATFWWRVSGDSLEGEGILDGDLIAVDRAGRRRSGRIVLALVDGQITAKKLAKRDGRWFLDPRARSNGYPNIPVTETTEIWHGDGCGTLTACGIGRSVRQDQRIANRQGVSVKADSPTD